MTRIRPPLAFKLALFHFTVEAQKPAGAPAARARLGAAIDEYRRAPEWRDASGLDKQLVTAADRALGCKAEDLDKALAGIDEVWRLVKAQASMADQVELERAKANPRPGDDPAAALGAAPAPLPLSEDGPPATRWDERADLQ